MPLRCPACGQKFNPKRSDARYCSNACRQRAHRARGREAELTLALEAARARYWQLVGELALARGVDRSVVLTGLAQTVDEHGDVFIGGEHVGHVEPDRPGWTRWGLEAAGPPWSPPPDR